jgi:hypothetical protein
VAKRIKVEFAVEAMKRLTINRNKAKAAAPLAEPSGLSEPVAVSLSYQVFANSRSVPMARNGVVTPNHPDMIWLVQRPRDPPVPSDPAGQTA